MITNINNIKGMARQVQKHILYISLLTLPLLFSCTDSVKFGDPFLEKAPGGTVTADTVFNNAEYTRQFLASAYTYQYYNLPCKSSNASPQCINYWKGMPDALGDTHQLFYNSSKVFSDYYNGALSSSPDEKTNYGVYPYTNEHIWENVRNGWLLIENVDRVPDMQESEKARIKDEARCLIAYTYFIAFRFYGGLPIIRSTFTGSESSYEMARGSARETVDFMVELLDEVINAGNLPWVTSNPAAETGHWTMAGAMALKCQVLQFAASPLFNADQPFYGTKYTMEDSSPVWYGGYDATLWTKFKDACAAFFTKLNQNGTYHLVQPETQDQAGYRYAYRYSYLFEDSPEILHSCRVSNNTSGNNYQWFNLRANERMSYCPTEEFIEMFPWADGTPFDWDKAEAEGKLDYMFVKGDSVSGNQLLQNRQYTRDPRLYETAAVNGALQTINWGDGNTSGQPYELWVGGTTAGTGPSTNTGIYATGFRNLKYIAGEAYDKKFPQWSPLLLSDMYLTYAEALIQADNNLTEAIRYIDAVRARVGLKGLVECNPDKNLTTDKNALLEELLRERACELALQTSRYFDLIRYKRAADFEKPLHGLRIYLMVKNSAGQWERSEQQWYNQYYDTRSVRNNPNHQFYYEPSHFDYEKFAITTGARVWWSQGFDPKWYLHPFPITEINKGYGLIQNPGW